MEVVVCVKQVPDTESVIKIKPDGSDIITDDLKYVMNPYDEFGVEEALQIKEKLGGSVTILCMGPARSVETIRTGLAMGADKAVHLDDSAFEGGDAFATSTGLAEALKGMEATLSDNDVKLAIAAYHLIDGRPTYKAVTRHLKEKGVEVCREGEMVYGRKK